MASVAEAFVTLRPDVSKFKSETESSLGGLGTLAKAGIAGLAGITAAVGIAGFKFDNMRQQSEIAFTTMLGDGQKAKAFLDNLQSFAAKTPFEFPELVTASQRLLAMGFNAEQVVPTLSAIGDAAAGLASGGEGISRMTTAMGQMLAKGKVSGEEMRQFAEAGVPAWDFLAKKIGVDIPTAMEMVSKGAVTGAVGVAAITEGMQKQFGGLMEQQSHTFGGLLSTFKDTFGIISGTIMQPFFAMATAGLQGVADLISSPAFTEGAKKFADGIAFAMQILGELFGVITGAAPNAGAKLTEALGPDAAKVIMGALAGIRDVAEKVFKDVMKGVDFVKKNWDIFGPAFAAIAATVIIPALVAWATAAGLAAIATIAALLPVLVPLAAVGAAVALLALIWKNNMGDIQGKTEAMMSFLKNAWDTVTSGIRNLWETAQAIWKQFTDNPPKMIGQMIGLIIGFFATLPGKIQGILTEALGKLIGFVGESIQAFVKWGVDNQEAIGKFLDQLPQKFWDGAVAAVKGLIGGLGSMAGAAWRAVQDLFGGIVEGVKQSLHIGSPSKVFEDIGKNMIRGLNAGLDQKIDLGGLGDIGRLGSPQLHKIVEVQRELKLKIEVVSPDGSIGGMQLDVIRDVALKTFGAVLGEAQREVRGGIA
jgi:tape measure domain-containing protein